jgi:hypothetical protein
MAIGQSYRKWFLKTISRRHYSLGEATEYYTRWLEDPYHFPNGPHPEIGSRAPLTHDDFRSDTMLEQYYLVPQTYPPTPPPQHNDSDEESDTALHHNNFAQTHEELITADPDDTTGILDTGAMMTTATRRHLALHRRWIDHIRPSTPGTSIRTGTWRWNRSKNKDKSDHTSYLSSPINFAQHSSASTTSSLPATPSPSTNITQSSPTKAPLTHSAYNGIPHPENGACHSRYSNNLRTYAPSTPYANHNPPKQRRTPTDCRTTHPGVPDYTKSREAPSLA